MVNAPTAVESGAPVPAGEDEAPLFALPAPDSIWTRTAFTPTYDPYDVVVTLYEVATKQATIVPLQPFVTQQIYHSRLGLKNCALKPRQVGLSTWNLALLHAVAWTTPNVNILVCTHLKSTTASMRKTCRDWTAWLNANHGAGIEVEVDNADMMQFVHTRHPETKEVLTSSTIYFATSGTEGAGRSRTIHAALLSEVAYWEGDEFGGIMESIPDNGLVFVESTPNGASGTFYDTYTTPSSYVKHFFPWWLEPSRSIDLGEDTLTYTEREQFLVARYGLTKHQIAWRRWKIADMKANQSKVPFEREYPEDDITCFTAGAKTAFPPARLLTLIERARLTPPLRVTDIQGEPWDPGGEFVVWQEPLQGRHYIATGDVGGGHHEGDKSYLIIRDIQTHRHVASLRGWWTPVTFARLSAQAAAYYNDAYLSHERNGVGDECVNEAANRLGYKNYHWSDRKVDGEFRAGFYIANGQRTPLLSSVVEEVVSDTFDSPDLELLHQMAAALLQRGSKATGWADEIVVPATTHDDALMAWAQSTRILRTLIVVHNRPAPVQVI